ncbi:hypothetical protein D5274_13845 [bacterium 1XD42-94]|nr:hypothetical protein [bacterium 1XD42-76]NBK06196.1 hypothetical protein [bacterium 1XD42-94]
MAQEKTGESTFLSCLQKSAAVRRQTIRDAKCTLTIFIHGSTLPFERMMVPQKSFLDTIFYCIIYCNTWAGAIE